LVTITDCATNLILSFPIPNGSHAASKPAEAGDTQQEE